MRAIKNIDYTYFFQTVLSAKEFHL